MYYNQIPSNYSNFVSPQIIKTGQVIIANRSLQHINCIIPAQTNRGALFLGDVVSTLKIDLLQKHQIKSILTCMIEPVSRLHQNIVHHKVLPIRDTLEFPISFYFNEAKTFIDQARSKGHNVLVHCHAGVSRSAAIVCAYLMLQNKWKTETALQFIRQKRYRAKPNASFFNQLKIFQEKQLKSLILSANIPNNSSLKLNDLKSQKIIIIKLDEEIQTHDQLLFLEQRRNLPKENKSYKRQKQNPIMKDTSRRYDLSKRQVTEPKKQRKIFKTERTKEEGNYCGLNHENDSLQKKGSPIHFSKAFDPKLMRSNVETKDVSNIVQIQDKKGLKRTGETDELMTKSMLNPYSKNNPAIIINDFRTPKKQNSVSAKNNIIFNNHLQKPVSGVVISYAQNGTKNFSRHSLAGQTSSYKQLY